MGKGQLGGAPSWFKKITDRIRRDISNTQGQNVITYPYYESSKTENGVQFSIRSDGTIKVNGTATADTYFTLHNYLKGDSNNLTVPFGIYALSGCPKGGSSSTYFMQVTMSMAGSEYDIITDYGDGGIGDIDNEGDYTTSTDAYIGIKFCVKSGTTVSDIIIKPMLEKGTASHEYQPTNLTNKTLLSTKVDKVDGKQLSTEDFTTKEKEALGSLMGGSVTGVKGNAESSYRTGNVNLTPANIGALATNGNSKSNTVTFTSNDVDDASATSWTSVSKLATGITHATFFQRVSQMFKNVRYIYKMLGTTDISKIGNGTVTGALSSLNSNFDKKISNAYYDNPIVKQGIVFNNNADGSFFTFRPILNENILQITKNDTDGLLTIHPDGSIDISADLKVRKNIPLTDIMQPLFGAGIIIQGDTIFYVGTISAIRNRISGLTYCSFNASRSGNVTNPNEFDWGVHYESVARILGFSKYRPSGIKGECTYYNNTGSIDENTTGHCGYIDNSVTSPRSGMGRIHSISYQEPIWNTGVSYGNWEAGCANDIKYIKGTFTIYLYD